jgi:peptidoglycan biosynthesis protein MviN/MurJ (putative lipid II flippase)
MDEPTLRERRVYLAYGVLAGGYSAWLLSWVVLMVGGWLTERY